MLKLERKRWLNSNLLFGLHTRSRKGDQLIDLAERNRLRIIHTLSRKELTKRENGKSLMETKNYTDFILTRNPGTVKDVRVRNNIKSSDHLMLTRKVGLNLMRETE